MASSRSKGGRRPVYQSADSDDNLSNDAAHVLRQFRLIFGAVRSHFALVERATALGGSQVWALSLVGDSPDLGVGELAHKMDIHQSTASNLIRTLVSRGLITTARDDSDRRSVRLRILEPGIRLLNRIPVLPAAVLPRALSHLDAPTLARLRVDLGTLVQGLETDTRAARKTLADL